MGAFLAAAGGLPSRTASLDPEIVPHAPPPVLLHRQSDSEESQEEHANAPAGHTADCGDPPAPSVQIELGLGVFDVGGCPEALLKRGVPEAAGCLPGESSSDDSEDEAPLIQEMSDSGAREDGGHAS